MRGFELSIDNKIAHIRLNRPGKRNALAAEFWTEFPKTITDIDAEAKARVIVISATGPIFCAGIDLSMLAQGIGGGLEKTDPQYGAAFLAKVQTLQDTFSALEACRLPVLVAVQGGCLGAGVDMITAADLRYCTSEAYFAITEIDVGMTADVGTFPRLLNHLPEGIVRELAYTGRKMRAEEARHYGLVNAVYDTQDEMLSAVMETARQIAEKAPLAVYGCKAAITYGRDHSTRDALARIALWNASFLSPSEIMEAVQARAQDRPGNFKDLPKTKPK
ncbi:MAG TPA: enoyl-CoA hydratase [Hellea balneolensis]|uniref:Enoyl-CoA hydratase n=1 Tax=Hellea balneolensis TaxID=287478 RepID=A0A7V5NXD7_9PROT|nr:enoyl-CoA hydratase [Hellea balneolensis]